MSGDRILPVEDDREIREDVGIFSKSQGYVVFQVADGIEGLKVLKDNEIGLAIVDVMMSRMGGITMTAKLREKHDFPIIFLSAKLGEADKILRLNMGTDNYIAKPFTPMELLAKVSSQLRRCRRSMDRSNSKQAENPKIHRLDESEVNEEAVEVMIDGSCVKVTPIELEILPLLIQNPGRVFPTEGICERVWNERTINTDTAMVHTRNLREKIEINPREPKYAKMIWGVEHKIEKQP